jgi:heme/copper-type cytochrome/quinol oxidase subunit 2
MPSCILTWVSLAAQAASGGGPATSQPWGLPPGHSTIAPDVDFLYTLILWITGIVFIGVEGLIIYFCIRYRRRPGGKPGYTHGNNTAEIIWTVSPALVLVAIALIQMPAWSKAKMQFPKSTDPDVVTIQTFAQQFSWNFRYPGEDGQFGTKDDLLPPDKTFWLPVGSTALMPIRSIDVIHSFFLFQMRVKQDVVPGLRNAVWFKPTGFYVAPIKKDQQEAYAPEKLRKGWRPKDYHMKWEGEYRWIFVHGEDEYREKFGSKAVAIDAVSFSYQDGLFRPTLLEINAKVLQNGQIRTGVPWREVEYVIVPFEGTCAELCGLNHFTMGFRMFVLPKAAYDYFMAQDTDEFDPESLDEKKLWFWNQWKN